MTDSDYEFSGSEWFKLSDGCMHLRNIENVLPCLCGAHPFPPKPVSIKKEGGIKKDYLLCGPPRAGSTVVWQISNEIHPNLFLRTHGFSDSCPLLFDFKGIICTVRHPFDIAASMFRVKEYDVEVDLHNSLLDMSKFAVLDHIIKSFGDVVRPVRPDLKLIFLRYEDFFNKDRERVVAISKFLEKELGDSEIDRISQKFNVQKNIERSSLLSDFTDVDENSKLHGGHIGRLLGSPGQGFQLDESFKKSIYETHRWFFDFFGYEYC